MRQRISALTVICMVVTIIGSAAAAYFAARIAAQPDRHSHSHHHDHGIGANATENDLHAWMHAQLKISQEQHEKLTPFETAFAETSDQLDLEISAAEQQLAMAVQSSSRDQTQIDQALQRLNHAHAQLRRLTLEHFFVMEQHLDPEQAKRLRRWTHDSLIRQLQSRN